MSCQEMSKTGRLEVSLEAARDALVENGYAQDGPTLMAVNDALHKVWGARAAAAERTVDFEKIGAVPARMADHDGIVALEVMAKSIQIIHKSACWDHMAMFQVRDVLCDMGAEIDRLRAGQPAAPADERAACIAWISSSYPHAWPENRAADAWDAGHVFALAWKRRAAIAEAAQEAPEIGQ